MFCTPDKQLVKDKILIQDRALGAEAELKARKEAFLFTVLKQAGMQ